MAKRIPSLNWLRVFEAAARAGSFVRAEERLNMSRPAVSQQIRALETHLGKPLFDRAASGVELTEAGRTLLAAVGESLGRMESSAAALSEASGQPLVIGVSKMLLIGWLAPRLPRFMSKHPDITLEIHSLIGRPETPPRNAELWIAFGQPPPGTSSTFLFGEQLVPVAHPKLASKIHTVDDLVQHPLIEVSDHMKNWTHVLDGQTKSQTRRLIHVDTTVTALSLAGSGGGVALARPPASDDFMERYGLESCLPDLATGGIESYHLLHDASRQQGAAARVFSQWISQTVIKSRKLV
ncbi:MAG: LysR family transcriptional regulator [Pseudomonadota bacterium]